jgi:hypothetical protein
MARRSPPRKVTYFEPVPPRLARNTIIESTFEVGRRFRCTLRVDCGQLEPGAVIRPVPGEWQPRMPEQLDEEELADWRAGRNAVYQLAALTIGARLAVADAPKPGMQGKGKPRRGRPGVFKQDDRHGGFRSPAGIKQHRSSIVQVVTRDRRKSKPEPAPICPILETAAERLWGLYRPT